jgi:lysophospholipase L1-like esterase
MNNKIFFIFKYLFFLIFFFICIEIFCRIFFKDYNDNNIFYDKNKFHRISKGFDSFYKYTDITKEFKFRVKDKDSELMFNEQIRSIWFVGDSVTNGYGVEYEDTYWQTVKRGLDKKDLNFNIYSVSSYGANYNEISSILDTMFKNYGKQNDIFIYQFNYNDILDILEDNNLENNDIQKPSDLIRNKLIRNTQEVRYKYLNHSTFFKILQHQASKIPYKTKGTCETRGIDALGPYTYAYFGKSFEKISQKLWNDYFAGIKKLNLIANEKKIKFYILISPISLQIKNHEKINKLNYDLGCSTVNARTYLISFLKKNYINYIDPYNNFQNEASNFNILFHNFDENHPNKNGHKIIGQTILKVLNIK